MEQIPSDRFIDLIGILTLCIITSCISPKFIRWGLFGSKDASEIAGETVRSRPKINHIFFIDLFQFYHKIHANNGKTRQLQKSK